MSVRIIAESRGGRGRRRQAEKHVVIAGAGQAGMLVVREIQRNPQLRLHPVGFVDDDPKKVGKRIGGEHYLRARRLFFRNPMEVRWGDNRPASVDLQD